MCDIRQVKREKCPGFEPGFSTFNTFAKIKMNCYQKRKQKYINSLPE